MCGFVGEFWCGPVGAAGLRAGDGDAGGQWARRGLVDLSAIEAAGELLAHRGPDDRGLYASTDGRLGIAFRRLAIIDPPHSRQPMTTPDGRHSIAFNGELYNFRQLRTELQAQGATFRTAGDTEVLLAMWARHGPEMLGRLEGMFAFAAYDSAQGRLLLARDRFGEKPLYYAAGGGRLAFASEPRGLLRLGWVDRTPSMLALQHYLTLGYVPAPLSAWQGIRKLRPGRYIELSAHPGRGGHGAAWQDASGRATGPTLDDVARLERPYWQLQVSEGPEDAAEAAERVRCELRRSVESMMVADVPLGALLSGGIDSAVVVGLMCQAAGRAGGVRTFTAGFEHAGFDERPAARAAAAHFGTDHTELLVRAQAAEAVEQAAIIYDEPFADSSAVATWLICREASRHVKVALVGDGGDEVFGGYDRYRAMLLGQRLGPPAHAALRAAGRLAGVLAPHDERSRLRRLARLGEGLDLPPAAQYFRYRRIFDPWQLGQLLTEPTAQHLDLEASERWFTDLYEQGDWPDEPTRAQAHDLATYLPDDLMVKSDRASMASSLELRCPMLDARVVAMGLSLPTRLRMDWRRGKKILRRAFAGMLPAGALGRAKRGFGVPLDAWLAGPLAGRLAELADGPLVQQGFARPQAIRSLVSEQLARRGDHRHRLWALLVLSAWLERHG